ncbi:alpha/beta hydrolase [Solimonas terrae]|uniref:Monoacylglycerol lipase n=1 Tax=Solimonas terrae TaxID=1396819 RepID=A0A6M2BW26_9GAMM|nr:alpha/beta hydrolase [Solimonas terrae]NGY06776.1 alpha/beta hydrolase [Solimonas terrae]
MRHHEGRFTGAGEIEIYWQAWQPPAGFPVRAVVVLAHGMGEHSGRYVEVASRLVDIGCAVYAIDHRGHGRSCGSRGLIDRVANAVADLDRFVQLAGTEQGVSSTGRPLFLLGHSMGGALSLGYALEHPDKLDGLLLSGPAVSLDAVPPLFGPISKWLSCLAPRLGTFPVDPSLVTRDPRMAAEYVADPLNLHGKVPVRTLAEMIGFVQALPPRLPALELPMLIMHGSDDQLAGVTGSEMVIDHVASADKTLKIYDGLYHEVFNELVRDRARVYRDMTDWLSARLPGIARKPSMRS